jgi:ubiquinone/menaquinone biosynthesis C-methylase UbiE
MIPANVKKLLRQKRKGKLILDIGCGVDKHKSSNPVDLVIGLDVEKIPGVEVVANIEKGIPFPDNSLDEVVSNYVFEQIKDFFFVMREVHRVLKPGGIAKIRVAFYAGWAQWNDPSHVRSFSYYSFDRFDEKHTRYYRDRYHGITFRIKKRRLIFAIGSTKIFNPIINPIVNAFPRLYSRFFAWILPCVDLYFELEKV